jgi:hypothetical protein
MGLISMILFKTHISDARRSANETFFEAPFSPCKGSRILNPVEAVRAHRYATKLFKAFGIKNMVRIATVYKVLATAVYPLADFACRLSLITYSFLSDGGGPILPKNQSSNQTLAFYESLIFAFQKATPYLTLRHYRNKYLPHWGAVHEIFRGTVYAALKTDKGYLPRDVHALLQIAAHTCKILL